MSKGNERFNEEAKLWDQNPDVHKASKDASHAIIAAYPELKKHENESTAATQGLDVLEIGAGTGILSFLIAPYVRALVAVDAADGMINALNIKLQQPGAPKNITALSMLLVDPEDSRLPPADSSQPDGPRRKYDLILSHLVLHHIADLETLLRTMHGCLKPGGTIALTDFEDFGPEARKFHPESKMDGVEWHGIPRKRFANMIADAGFVDVDVRVGWTWRKDVERYPGEWGQKKPSLDEIGEQGYAELEFPFLLCTGTRP